MPSLPPDPTGRPSSAKRTQVPGNDPPSPETAADAGEAAVSPPSPAGATGPPAKPASDSTHSHYPSPESRADLPRSTGSSGSSRRNPSSDILHILANPGASPIVSGAALPGNLANSDDAPTIITQNRPAFAASSPQPLIASNDPPSLANRRLGHFELIKAIGAGGMAAVLQARDLELGRIVALKILPPEAARDPESVTRFKQEARAAAMLDHENVARVYYCGEDQGLHFIAFEFVEGENLRVLIDKYGTVPAVDCIRYMIQVAAGLNHAAERGVVHRDIKPSNIIITPDGRAKIVDMGLARHLDSLAVNGGVTQSGVTLGTFDYISPEQALDPRRADVRSDIYSLGCTFYHALTGRPPVPEGTAAKKLHAHQHVDPLDPRVLNPAIPDGLAAILSGMMAKDPDQRYQNPTDLIAHLKGLMEQLQLQTDAADSVIQAVPARQSVPTEAPRLRLSWVAAVCAVALAAAAFAMMTTGDSGPQSSGPPWAAKNGTGKDAPTAATPVKEIATVSAEDGGGIIENAKQLVEALTNPKLKGQKQKLQLGPGKFNLAELDLGDGLVVERKELELAGSTASTTEIVLPASVRGGMMVKSDLLTVRAIRFEFRPVDAVHDEDAARAHGVIVRSPLSAFEDCYFFASRSHPRDEVIALAFAGSEPAKVTLSTSAFALVSVAIQAPASSDLAITDCGFAARTAAIQIVRDDGNEPAPADIALSRSSFMLEPASAVVDLQSPGKVTAGYCVFAAVGKAQPSPPKNPFGTVLNVKDKATTYSFANIGSQKNAYYQVKPLTFVSNDALVTATFEECKANMLPVSDKDAVLLAQRPWSMADPTHAFARSDPWSAFGLKIASEPAVFVDGDPKVIGAQFHSDTFHVRRAYPETLVRSWPPARPRPSELSQKIWNPTATDEELLDPGTSNDLLKLLRNARPDEVILIQHNGLLHLPETIELKARGEGARVTFKPYPGCKPVLTSPNEKNPKLDQPLFRLISGEVIFEGVQFLLKPSLPRNSFRIAAVTVAGGKGCTFTDCFFTLAEGDDDQVAAVVRVADPDKIMVMAEGVGRSVPEIAFRQCVIRGKGRGVWIEDSCAAKVELSQSVAAIDGPLLLADSGGKPAAGARSSLKLNRVTAFAGGPLLVMHGAKAAEMRASGLATVDVQADECLFAAVPGAGQPLVELDGIDPTEVKSLLVWHVKNPNRYANFDADAIAAIVRPGSDATDQKEWNWDRWIAFAGEPAGRPLGKVQFALAPAGLKELAAVTPDDVQVKDVKISDAPDAKPDDAGVSGKLPAPWTWNEEAKPE